MRLLQVFCLFFVASGVYAQADSLSNKDVQQLVDNIKLNEDTLIAEQGPTACDCIDSVRKIVTEKKEQLKAFSKCITESARSVEMLATMMSALQNKGGKKEVNINIDVNSNGGKYYYMMERWLMTNCAILRSSVSSDDDLHEKSMSENQAALDQYYKGIEYLKKEDYETALPYFKKAVEIDPEFVFALDDLAVCYRRLNKFAQAEQYYKASLKVDPMGHMALQNLPVVYTLQEKLDEAIQAYLDLLKAYPGDPEVYYGIGTIYLNGKKDPEAALDYLCKAYVIYVNEKSPYRSDAEKLISFIYQDMKKNGKEAKFDQILKDNNINTTDD